MLFANGVAGLVALIHIYIFTLESLSWSKPATRRAFQMGIEQSEACRLLAFNQGFYNLFLALAIGIGLVALAFGEVLVGQTLISYAVASAFGAGLVLFLSHRRLARAAGFQALPSLLYFAIVFAAHFLAK